MKPNFSTDCLTEPVYEKYEVPRFQTPEFRAQRLWIAPDASIEIVESRQRTPYGSRMITLYDIGGDAVYMEFHLMRTGRNRGSWAGST